MRFAGKCSDTYREFPHCLTTGSLRRIFRHAEPGGGLSSFPQIPRKQADSPGRKTRNLGRLARFRPRESVAWGIRGLSEKDKKQAVSDGSDIPGFRKEVRSLSVSIC